MKEILIAILRHVATAAGASEYMSSEETNQAIGAILFLGGLAWSIFDKVKNKRKLAQVGAQVSLLGLLVLSSGCVAMYTTEYNPETKSQVRNATVGLFAKGTLQKAEIGKRTKTTSATVSINGVDGQTDAEGIRAVGEMLGAGIAAGAKKAIAP